MQIHELEEFLGGELVERHQGEAILTERGVQIAERAASILSATRDLVDFARQSGRLLTGSLRLGIIPTLAPYILPRFLPELQRRYPDLRLSLLERQTKTLLNELTRGNVDLLLLALPVETTEVETLQLFEDRFLLAVPANDPLPERSRVTPQDVRERNLLLLEEGHCLREQALTYCAGALSEGNTGFFATSLATITQMVATGYGVTLLPESPSTPRYVTIELSSCGFPSRSHDVAWGSCGGEPRRAERISSRSVRSLSRRWPPAPGEIDGVRKHICDTRP